jgi:nitroreductase
MFMMALMLAEEVKGLATCAQEAWMTSCKTVCDALGFGENERVYCGMALGYADKEAAVNSLRSSRVPVEDFAVFDGF